MTSYRTWQGTSLLPAAQWGARGRRQTLVTVLPAGSMCPRRGLSSAFPVYILSSGTPEPHFKEKSQWIRDAYKKIQGVPFKSEELWDYIHFFYKMLFLKKGQRLQFVICSRCGQWVRGLHVLVGGLQASLHSGPPEPQAPFRVKRVSPERTY